MVGQPRPERRVRLADEVARRAVHGREDDDSRASSERENLREEFRRSRWARLTKSVTAAEEWNGCGWDMEFLSGGQTEIQGEMCAKRQNFLTHG